MAPQLLLTLWNFGQVMQFFSFAPGLILYSFFNGCFYYSDQFLPCPQRADFRSSIGFDFISPFPWTVAPRIHRIRCPSRTFVRKQIDEVGLPLVAAGGCVFLSLESEILESVFSMKQVPSFFPH